MLALYNTALLPFQLAAEVWAALPTGDAKRLGERAERLGRRPLAIRPGAVWLHGASVGEVRLVTALARALRRARPELPLASSAVTAAGRAQLPSPPVADEAFFLPLDFRRVVRRVLERLAPSALALVETELWPNLLHEASRAGVPAVLLNARLAERKMGRYRRWSRLYAPLLARIATVGAQSEGDAARFVELGTPAERVRVTGNLKYDLPLPDTSPEELRRRLGLVDARPVFVAGSTAPEEVPAVLDAFQEARRAVPALLLVLAPRHLDRADAAEEAVRARGLEIARLSSASPVGSHAVLLVDTIGQLAALYQLASVAFVGGSLAPVGGHNVLEPAAVGVPVLFGPHTEHVREPAAALAAAGGGFVVESASALVARLSELLADPEGRAEASRRALALVAANRGALDRSVEIVLEAIEARPRSGVR